MKSLVMFYTRKAFRFGIRACRHVLYHLWGMLRDTITIQTVQGTFTLSTRDCGIGLALYREGQFEHDLSLRVVEQLKDQGWLASDGIVMLDIGANIGVTSIGLLLAGQVTHAVLVEPEPRNFDLLRKNVQQNFLTDRAVCIQIAVGEEESTLSMELSPNNPGDHRVRSVPSPHATERDNESSRSTIQVPCVPLPQILERAELRRIGFASPSLLWIDVQGYEGYVFRGAGCLLRNGLPTVSEIWPYGILRAGMEPDEFCRIVGSIWTDYWIDRRDRFIRYPISAFDRYLEELGNDGYAENVIFTRQAPRQGQW